VTTGFLDTNILLYSISVDPKEAHKRAASRELLERHDCALSVQVFQEFFARATKPRNGEPITATEAIELIRQWCRYPVQDMSLTLMHSAFEIHLRHRFSYWDSAIIAAAAELGCATLFTEDLSHGQIVNGVRIINPFLPAP
jgi:predicted nucleic acid-binding protein